jgi:hypothetical protein
MFENLLKIHFNKNIIGYENICKITNNIYHGNYKSLDYICNFKITRIIMIEYKDSKNKQNKSILTNNKIDKLKVIINKEDKLISFYDKIWNFFEENYNKNILIQCEDGSISLILLISYLISYKFYSYEEALQHILIKKKENNMNIDLLDDKYLHELKELDKDLSKIRNKMKN